MRHTRDVVFRLAGRTPALASIVCISLGILGCRQDPEQGPTPSNEAEERTLDEFEKRVNAYVDVHRSIEQDLPALPTEATPRQIDMHQREFGRRLAAARATAARGELFTPDMEALVRQHLARIFAAHDGPALKASVNDENPVGISIQVNGRYPDEVPLSTMPPNLLQILPKMPEELQYRFVGRSLVIMDEHAHLIADYIPNVVPE